MPTPLARTLRYSAAISIVALSTACSKPNDSAPADSSSGMKPAAPMPSMDVMRDSALSMLHAACAAEASGGGTPTVELIVAGDQMKSKINVDIEVKPTSSKELMAELGSGAEEHATCGGMVPMIRFGGTAMFTGHPVLRLTSATPVTVVARTIYAQRLAGPVEVKPGQKGASIAWGQ
jgi:hypothetical protein